MQIAYLFASYLLGAIPFGLLVARAWAGQDVRQVGSGNIGATNVARAAGKGAAGVVLLLDLLKGFVPAALALPLFGAEPWWAAGAGFAAFLGHVFPVYLGFRGGKGVATALGVCLALVPWAALIGALVYAVVLRLSRISSLGSLCGGVVGAAASFALAPERTYAWTVLAMVVLILVRHRGNIDRLLRRSEPTI